MKKLLTIILFSSLVMACTDEEPVQIDEKDQIILKQDQQATGDGGGQGTSNSGNCPNCQ